MKIQKFLDCVQEKIMYYPDINIKTVKMFMDKFEKYLSKREKERFTLQIQMIREFTSKQITIDSFVLKEKTNQLENKLNELKKK